jgi:propanol-preferring alcohol dehydrogenase
MRAVAFLGPGRVDFVEVPVPAATPGRVLLRTLAAGVCQTDLHVRTGTDARIAVGRILGHEIAGEIVELGDGVDGWQPGQQAVVYPVWSCGICPACQAGRRNACLGTNGRRAIPPTPGITADGGMAEYISAPASALIDIGPLDSAVAATMTDAALSPYGSIKAVEQTLYPGTSAIVIGLGGLGSMALQILRAITPTQIIAIDIDDAALARAGAWADHALRADVPGAVDQILEWTGGYGAAVVLDFVGTEPTLALAADVVAPFGAIRVTGMGGGTLTLRADAASQLPRGATISPRLFSGSFPDLMEVMALARAGALRPEITRFPFAQALTALDTLESGQLKGRAVLEFEAD